MKDKVPFYEIVNMFFTGAVFSILLFFLLYEQIELSEEQTLLLTYCEKWSVITSTVVLILMYEIGFLLNKIGAITLGEWLSKKIWPKGKYDISISSLEAENSKFRTLNTELHVIRTHIVLYIVLAIIALVIKKCCFSIYFIAIAVILLLAGRRTNNYMNNIKSGYQASQQNNVPPQNP